MIKILQKSITFILLSTSVHSIKAQTWNPIFVPGTPTGTTTISSSSMDDFDFGDDNNGIVSLGYSYHITNDGGATWSHWKDFSPYPQIKAIKYLNANTVVVGGDSKTYKSNNNGNTFVEKGNIGGTVNGIDFNGSFGVAVNQVCGAGYTNDSGESWTAISNTVLCNNLSSMRNVCVVNANTAFINGSNNNFFKTANGGVTWTPISTSTISASYSGVSFANASVGYAIKGTTLFKTSDGGTTWTNITAGIYAAGTPTSVSFGDVLAVDANYVVVGVSGRLLVSADGGNTFTIDFINTSCTTCIPRKIKKSGNFVYAGISNSGSHPKVYKKSINSVSLNEINNNRLTFLVYPNPTNGLINFAGIDLNETHTVIVTNIDGKVIRKETLNQSKVDFTDLENGIYFIELKDTKGKTGIIKFVKN